MADFSTDTTFLGDSLFGGGQMYDLPEIDWTSLLGDAWPSYMSDPGLGGLTGGEQMYFDTQTGQLVTLAQAQAIDPTFTPEGAISQIPTGMSAGGTGSTPPVPSQPFDWRKLLGMTPAAITALAGLGSLGAAGAALFGAGNQPGTATTQTNTTPNALNNPQVQQLLGTPGSVGAGGGGAGGGGGTPGYTGGTGLTGAAGQAAANLQGPMGLLQQQIGAIPQLNPQLQAAIGQNALGFSRGDVPTLNNPQAQAYFQNVLGGQNAAVDYQSTNALTDAMQQMRNRGFAGGAEIFREGAPAAAMGPILAQANAQKAMNLGNINAQQLNYAMQLPKLGADLGTVGLNQQNIPFNAYTQALGAQGQIPLDLLRILTGQGGTNTTQTSTGAPPNFLQTIGQIMPVMGTAGSFLSSPLVAGAPAGSLYGGTTGTPSLWSQFGGLFGS